MALLFNGRYSQIYVLMWSHKIVKKIQQQFVLLLALILILDECNCRLRNVSIMIVTSNIKKYTQISIYLKFSYEKTCVAHDRKKAIKKIDKASNLWCLPFARIINGQNFCHCIYIKFIFFSFQKKKKVRQQHLLDGNISIAQYDHFFLKYTMLNFFSSWLQIEIK